MKSRKVFFTLLFCCLFTSSLFAQEAWKFQEAGDLECEAVKAGLDRLAIELQKNSDVRAYLIFYGGKSYFNYVYDKKKNDYVRKQLFPKKGEAKARVEFWKPFLVKSKGIDEYRIEVIDGGYQEKHTVEFWIVPLGTKPPTPNPTLTEKDIKFRKGKIRFRDFLGDC